MDLFKNEVVLDTTKGEVKFTIYSEIEDLEPAVINWSVRTDEFTAESFVDYVEDKDPSIEIYTESQYNKLLKNEKSKYTPI